MIFTPILLAVIFDLSTAKKTECPLIISRADPVGIYKFVKKLDLRHALVKFPNAFIMLIIDSIAFLAS